MPYQMLIEKTARKEMQKINQADQVSIVKLSKH